MKNSADYKNSVIAAIFHFAKNLDAYKAQGLSNQSQKEMISMFIEINKLIGYLSLSKSDLEQIHNFVKPKLNYEEYKKLKRTLELHFKNNSDLSTIAMDIGDNLSNTNRLLQHGIDYILDNLKNKDFKSKAKSKTELINKSPKSSPRQQVRVKKKSGFWSFVRTLIFWALLFYAGKYVYENYISQHTGSVQELITEYRDSGKLSLGAKPSSSNTLRIEGPTYIILSIKDMEPRLRSQIPGLRLETAESNSSASIRRLMDGAIDVAAASRMPSIEERKQSQRTSRLLTDHKIAMDAVLIVVHPSNPVSKLSVEDLKTIFTGYATWSQFGWPSNPAPIEKFSGPPEGGTYTFMKERVLFSEPFADDVVPVVGIKQMLKMVENNPNAISFLSLGDLPPESAIRVMRISTVFDAKGCLPMIGSSLNDDALRRGEYPLTRYVYLLTAGDLSQNHVKLIETLRSEAATEAFAKHGLLSI